MGENGDINMHPDLEQFLRNNNINQTPMEWLETVKFQFEDLDLEESFLPLDTIIPIIIFSFTILIGLVGNILILLAVIKQSKTDDSPTNIYLGSLAAADLLLICFCLPSKILKLVLISWEFGEFSCKLVQFLEVLSAISSTVNLTAISLERYYAVLHPLEARVICTRSRAKKVTVAVWTTSALLSMPNIFVTDLMEVGMKEKAYWCVPNWNSPQIFRIHEVYLLVTILVLPCLVMSYNYVNIITHLKKMSLRRAALTSNMATERKCQSQDYDSDSSLMNHHASELDGSAARTEARAMTKIKELESKKKLQASHLREANRRRMSDNLLQDFTGHITKMNQIGDIATDSSLDNHQTEIENESGLDECESLIQPHKAENKTSSQGNSTNGVENTNEREPGLEEDEIVCFDGLAVQYKKKPGILNHIVEDETEEGKKRSNLAKVEIQKRQESENCLVKVGSGKTRGHTTIQSLKTQKSSETDKRTEKIENVLMLVIILFILCWTPLLVFNVLGAFGVYEVESTGLKKHVKTALSLLAYLNSCMNPVVYGFLSRSFRARFMTTMKTSCYSCSRAHPLESPLL